MTENPTKETLDDLASEAMQADEEQAQAEYESENYREERQADPQLTAVFATLFKAVIDIACTRAGVAGLSDGEASALGEATANVVAFYDIQPTSEGAVWLGLGMTVAGVSIPRMAEYSANQKQKAANPQVPAAASSGEPASPPARPKEMAINDGGLL